MRGGWTTHAAWQWGEREFHRMHCMFDFSFFVSLLSLSPTPLFFSPAPFSHLFLCLSSCLLSYTFFSQEDKNQLFHCIPRLCGSAGLGAGDALWCHRAGSRHLDLWGDVLPGPDISRCPAHDSIDFSPVLHFFGQVRTEQCDSRAPCWDKDLMTIGPRLSSFPNSLEVIIWLLTDSPTI